MTLGNNLDIYSTGILCHDLTTFMLILLEFPVLANGTGASESLCHCENVQLVNLFLCNIYSFGCTCSIQISFIYFVLYSFLVTVWQKFILMKMAFNMKINIFKYKLYLFNN
jgi:hypothetical protein